MSWRTINSSVRLEVGHIIELDEYKIVTPQRGSNAGTDFLHFYLYSKDFTRNIEVFAYKPEEIPKIARVTEILQVTRTLTRKKLANGRWGENAAVQIRIEDAEGEKPYHTSVTRIIKQPEKNFNTPDFNFGKTGGENAEEEES